MEKLKAMNKTNVITFAFLYIKQVNNPLIKIFILLNLFVAYPVFAQVGIGTQTPHNSAVLELFSTEKGLLIPRLNSTQRLAISNPANGLLVYDEDIRKIYFFDGTAWNELGREGPAGPQGPKGDDGNPGANGADGANGANGSNGTDGADGADGVGITNIVDNSNGTFTVNYTDGGNDSFSVPVGGGTGWELAGNGGTDDLTEFIGTTDAQDLIFKTENIERLRIKQGNATLGGYVGINNNNPTARLDVMGGAPSTNFSLAVKNTLRTNFGVRDDGNVVINEKLGIGTVTPDEALHIQKGVNAKIIVEATAITTSRKLEMGTSFTGIGPSTSFLRMHNPLQDLIIRTNNGTDAERFRFKDNGQLILGESATGLVPVGTNRLTVYGDVDVTGDITATGTITGSDGRFKKNVSSIRQGLDVILGLRPVTFQWKNSFISGKNMEAGKKYYGFISQEVEKVFPETVVKKEALVGNKKVADFRFINLTNFTPVLVKALQEQQVIIDRQNDEINSLKKRIMSLENKTPKNIKEKAFQEKLLSLEAELDLLKAYIYDNSALADQSENDSDSIKLSDK